MKRLVSAIVMAAVISAVALVPATALATDANGNHNTYTWIVASVTQGDLTPNTSMAPDGSTITMAGTGSLKAGPGGTASGGGTYTTSGGASGTWTATGVEGFVSYGSGAGEFPGLPPGSTGGEAKLKISLSNGEAGVLTIHCLLGSPPAAKTMMEGITLILGRGVSGEYTTIVSGDTLFILQP